jgi:hypothetical protein
MCVVPSVYSQADLGALQRVGDPAWYRGHPRRQ